MDSLNQVIPQLSLPASLAPARKDQVLAPLGNRGCFQQGILEKLPLRFGIFLGQSHARKVQEFLSATKQVRVIFFVFFFLFGFEETQQAWLVASLYLFFLAKVANRHPSLHLPRP